MKLHVTTRTLQQTDAIEAAVACQVAKAFQEGTCQAEAGSPVACRSRVGEACQGVRVWVAHSQVGASACRVGTHTLAEVDTGHLKRSPSMSYQHLGYGERMRGHLIDEPKLLQDFVVYPT